MRFRLSDFGRRCVVIAPTGYVAGRLVPRLLGRGHRVRAVARTPSSLYGAPWRDDAEVVWADPADGGGEGADGGEGVARNVVVAARRAGVKRLVYLGSLHRRSNVNEILNASGVETLALRAGMIVGTGSAPFEMIRHLSDRLPVMITPTWVHNRIQPIAIGDVLHYLVEAATAKVDKSRTWDIGGPDVLEYGEMMQIYADTAGLRRRVMVVLPLLTTAFASRWVGLVTPIPTGLARRLVESLRCTAVMDNHDIDTLIAPPVGGLTGYRDAVSLALNRITDGAVEKPWPNAPSELAPGDPNGAGAVVYTIKRSGWTPATEEHLWRIVKSISAQRDWQIIRPEAGQVVQLRKNTRVAGDAWLHMRVAGVSGPGSAYHQRMDLYPKGIASRVYWYVGLRRRRRRFRELFREVVDRARTPD
ncbi:MAG: nucleoside-diphosphate sugar epimerase [Mycobacteriaceae bacterium]|nr:nucleoside-diphosphate sugar epimerase [Mycobacteriaceae bacterium]